MLCFLIFVLAVKIYVQFTKSHKKGISLIKHLRLEGRLDCCPGGKWFSDQTSSKKLMEEYESYFILNMLLW